MFDQTFVNARAATHRPLTITISVMLQSALVAAMLIVPLLHVAKLDLPARVSIMLPVQKVDIKVKPEHTASAPSSSTLRPVFREPGLRVPTAVPHSIDMTPDPPGMMLPATASAGGSSLDGLLPGMTIEPRPPAAIPVQPTRPATPQQGPFRVSNGVQAAKLIVGPKPAYPPLARAARVQGTVHIQAIIGRDGAIGHLQVLSGPPLLIKAALEAVQNWRYRPTLLNGEPVEVITEIDVSFTLSQ